jgi:hypothetical protein
LLPIAAKQPGTGRCPGWPKATPQGPQGLDSGQSQRIMPGRKATPSSATAGPPRTGAHHDSRTDQTSSTAPQATQRIPAAAHSKPAHGTGRGASNDGRAADHNGGYTRSGEVLGKSSDVRPVHRAEGSDRLGICQAARPTGDAARVEHPVSGCAAMPWRAACWLDLAEPLALLGSVAGLARTPPAGEHGPPWHGVRAPRAGRTHGAELTGRLAAGPAGPRWRA